MSLRAQTFKIVRAMATAMQIYVMEKTEKSLKLGLKDASTTIVEPIIDELNKDPKVDIVRYIVDHPDLTDPIVEIKVSAGTPGEAVKRACAAVGEYFSGLTE